MELAVQVAGELIGAALLGILGYLFGKDRQRKRVMAKIDAAPTVYVEELDRLIQQGASEGPENAIINARAIVAARNSLRSSMLSISSNLNSEIDTLAGDIGIDTGPVWRPVTQDGTRGATTDTHTGERAYDTIMVLRKIWPARKKQIEIELRKLFAELDIAPR
jgi:hypothetical protein